MSSFTVETMSKYFKRKMDDLLRQNDDMLFQHCVDLKEILKHILMCLTESLAHDEIHTIWCDDLIPFHQSIMEYLESCGELGGNVKTKGVLNELIDVIKEFETLFRESYSLKHKHRSQTETEEENPEEVSTPTTMPVSFPNKTQIHAAMLVKHKKKLERMYFDEMVCLINNIRGFIKLGEHRMKTWEQEIIVKKLRSSNKTNVDE